MRESNGAILVLLAGLAFWPMAALWVFAGPEYVLAVAAGLEALRRLWRA